VTVVLPPPISGALCRHAARGSVRARRPGGACALGEDLGEVFEILGARPIAFIGLADNRFGFQELLQPEDPAFPTDPRLFEPTEGSKRIVT
jgi:hypothetical protein